MIKKTTLEDIELTGNYLIVKPDPNFDFIPMQSPNGEIQIHLNYNPQDATKHVSITGTVLKRPIELKYFGPELLRSAEMTNEEKSSLMRNSMPYKTKLNVNNGEKVYFDYHNQFQADDEGRLIEVDGHGICMLMKYETFYGKEVKGEFIPLNGWVIFTREQQDSEYETASGLTIIKNVNVYESNKGEVVCADLAVSEYLDGSSESEILLVSGDKILIDVRFGYRIAYAVHAGEMTNYEIIRRKNILATFD